MMRSAIFIWAVVGLVVCGCARNKPNQDIAHDNEDVVFEVPTIVGAAAHHSNEAKFDAGIPVLAPIEDARGLASYKKILKLTPSSPNYEKARIDYLLERLQRTSYNFLRNGETHNGQHAVALMRYKLVKHGAEVKSAADFVDNIAAGSRASGQPYQVKIGGRYYLSKDVLSEELRELDSLLAQDGFSQEETVKNI